MKKTLYSTLGLLFALLFTACGGGGTSDGKELIFSIWGTPEQVRVEKRIVNLFMKENPDIKINVMHVVRDYGQKMLSMSAAGNAPDIMMIERSLFPIMADKGAFLDITELMDRDKFDRDAYYDLTWKTFTYQGRYFALPRDISGHVMFYNKDMLEKSGVGIPVTYSEFDKACAKLSIDNDGDGILDSYGSLITYFNLFAKLWCIGGDVYDNPHDPKNVLLNSSLARESMEWFQRLYKNKSVASPEVVADQGTHALFAAGKLGFHFNGKWMSPKFKTIRSFTWEAALPPKDRAGHYTTHGGTCYTVSAKTKYPDEAWKFIQFYTSARAVSLAVRGGRTTPVLKKVANSKLFLEQHPPQNTRTFIWTMENGRQILYSKYDQELASAINEELEPLSTLTAPVSQVQEKVYKRVSALLKSLREADGK
jgi:multiple sugar transport system substrate-binding protein